MWITKIISSCVLSLPVSAGIFSLAVCTNHRKIHIHIVRSYVRWLVKFFFFFFLTSFRFIILFCLLRPHTFAREVSRYIVPFYQISWIIFWKIRRKNFLAIYVEYVRFLVTKFLVRAMEEKRKIFFCSTCVWWRFDWSASIYICFWWKNKKSSEQNLGAFYSVCVCMLLNSVELIAIRFI